MNMRTIGIGIVAIVLIFVISLTASARPDPGGATDTVQYNNVTLGTYTIQGSYVDSNELGDGVDTIYINVTTVIGGSPNLNISYIKEGGSTDSIVVDLGDAPAAGTWFDVTVVDLVDVSSVSESVTGTSGVVSIVANVSRQKMHQRVGGTDSAKGGFVTEINLAATAVTAKWQGYYGNISGSIALADSQGHNMFTWDWIGGTNAVVIATTNESIPPWSSIQATNADDMGLMETAAWTSWSTGSTDGALATFDHENDSVIIAGVTVSATRGTDSLGAENTGDFSEVVIKDQAIPASKDDFLFVAKMNNDKTSFDGTAKDFEMLVATPDTGAPETYYFYVELS
ncbi:MAG: hypothetical protein DRP42_04340 [Tenericutes bacterium]|nr:MAG: hypothetical protein DRP42_04340 [Mycoplasmatota bacterium]